MNFPIYMQKIAKIKMFQTTNQSVYSRFSYMFQSFLVDFHICSNHVFGSKTHSLRVAIQAAHLRLGCRTCFAKLRESAKEMYGSKPCTPSHTKIAGIYGCSSSYKWYLYWFIAMFFTNLCHDWPRQLRIGRVELMNLMWRKILWLSIDYP